MNISIDLSQVINYGINWVIMLSSNHRQLTLKVDSGAQRPFDLNLFINVSYIYNKMLATVVQSLNYFLSFGLGEVRDSGD